MMRSVDPTVEIIAPIMVLLLASDDNSNDRQNEEQDAQSNGDTEENLLDTAPGGEHATCVSAGQATQTSTLALQNYTGDQCN